MGPAPQRARLNARKRLDDSAFIGPSGVKRSNADKAEGSDARLKRKRVDPPPPQYNGSANGSGGALRRPGDEDEASSMVDFTLLPTEALHRYIIKWDLLPLIWPAPYSSEQPPLPGALLAAPRASSPSAALRRDPNRRRSTRLSDEVAGDAILADVAGVHDALAGVCQRHWDAQVAKEADSLVQFMFTVRTHDLIAAAGEYLRPDA